MPCTVVQGTKALALKGCTVVQGAFALVFKGCTVVQGTKALALKGCTVVQRDCKFIVNHVKFLQLNNVQKKRPRNCVRGLVFLSF